MLWVTRNHIHLDRVASPWLIRRFVDREATFGFHAPEDELPADAVPFALPGAELGQHDGEGSTFRKILRRYSLNVAELERMAEVVEAGIAIAQNRQVPAVDTNQLHLAVSLAAFSEAMTVLRPDDHQNLHDSIAFYDGLYQTLWTAYGPAPAVPSGDIAARVLAYRQAVDWSAALPPWRD